MKEYTEFIPVVNNEDVNNIKVRVFYSLGGINYFTCGYDARGYYLSVTPVKREARGSYTSESAVLWSGYKKLLKEVKRKSAKAEEEAINMAKTGSITKLIIDKLVAELGLELVE